MTGKLAIKKLTASDLTFFEWHFRHRNAGNQKAINLNRDVFIDKLYPDLPAIARRKGPRFPIELSIYGPGLANEYNRQRKIVKGNSYKNWRLDGEVIYDPEDEPGRFSRLEPGDLAVFQFVGDEKPQSARMVLVAATLPEDCSLHEALTQHMSGRSMVAVSSSELSSIIKVSSVSDAHPIHELVLDADLEDAAFEGIHGIQKLARRPSGRQISRDQLQHARQNAEEIGQQGEDLVNAYLSALKEEGKIRDFEWVSTTNAVSPYDFRVDTGKPPGVLIEVKSTDGDFDRIIHISFNELRKMAEGPEQYDIYRVYNITGDSAKLRVARDVGKYARTILDSLKNLPNGVSVDSISVAPSVFAFDAAETLRQSDGEETEDN